MNDENEISVWIGEPYVKEDINGKLVILQEERLIRGKDEISILEKLVNPDPSPAEIFRVRLKNPYDSDEPNFLKMPKIERE